MMSWLQSKLEVKSDTMSTTKSNALAIFGKQLQTDGGNSMRQMVQEIAENLMDSEADALCETGFGERRDERVNQRDGCRDPRVAARSSKDVRR